MKQMKWLKYLFRGLVLSFKPALGNFLMLVAGGIVFAVALAISLALFIGFVYIHYLFAGFLIETYPSLLFGGWVQKTFLTIFLTLTSAMVFEKSKRCLLFLIREGKKDIEGQENTQEEAKNNGLNEVKDAP